MDGGREEREREADIVNESGGAGVNGCETSAGKTVKFFYSR